MARRNLRSLVKLVDKNAREVTHTNFEGELGEPTQVDECFRVLEQVRASAMAA